MLLLRCPPAGVGVGAEAQEEEGEGGGGNRQRRRGWGQHAGVGPENTPLHLLEPKTDLHGLGFDPFKVRPGIEVWHFIAEANMRGCPLRLKS